MKNLGTCDKLEESRDNYTYIFPLQLIETANPTVLRASLPTKLDERILRQGPGLGLKPTAGGVFFLKSDRFRKLTTCLFIEWGLLWHEKTELQRFGLMSIELFFKNYKVYIPTETSAHIRRLCLSVAFTHILDRCEVDLKDCNVLLICDFLRCFCLMLCERLCADCQNDFKLAGHPWTLWG